MMTQSKVVGRSESEASVMCTDTARVCVLCGGEDRPAESVPPSVRLWYRRWRMTRKRKKKRRPSSEREGGCCCSLSFCLFVCVTFLRLRPDMLPHTAHKHAYRFRLTLASLLVVHTPYIDPYTHGKENGGGIPCKSMRGQVPNGPPARRPDPPYACFPSTTPPRPAPSRTFPFGFDSDKEIQNVSSIIIASYRNKRDESPAHSFPKAIVRQHTPYPSLLPRNQPNKPMPKS